MLKRTLLVSVLAMSAVSAYAYDIPSDYYLRVDAARDMTTKIAGVDQYLKSSSMGYAQAKAKKNMGFQVGIGMYLPDHLRVDVTAGMGNYKMVGSKNAVASIGNASIKAKSTHAMLSGYYDILDIKGLVPYIMAGAGYSKNKLSTAMTTLKIKNKSGVAWQIGCGAAYHIDDKIAVELGYRYADFGIVAKNTDINSALTGSTPARPAYTMKAPKITTSQLQLGVRFSF
jgi:opacity protein-like surface antigen